jgi:hypothetical protein
MELCLWRSFWAVVGRRHDEPGVRDTTEDRARSVIVTLVLVGLIVVALAAGLVPLAVAGGSSARPSAITGGIYLKGSTVRSGGTVQGEVVFQNPSTQPMVLMRGCRIDGLYGIGLRASDGYVQAPAFSAVGCSREQALVAKPGTTVYRFTLRASYTECSQSTSDPTPRSSKFWIPLCLNDAAGNRDVAPPLPAGRYAALFFPAGVWHGPRVKPARLVVIATGAVASARTEGRSGGSSVRAFAAGRAARGVHSGRWSAPAALVGAGTAAASLGISATPGGLLLAGWLQGPPPKVMAGGPASAGAASASATTQAVMVAGGSFGGGFQPPIKLSSALSGSLTNLAVTLSAPDVGYAVWAQTPATTLRLSVIRSGRVVVAGRLLFRDAVPLALFPLSRGRAALVFDQYGHGTPFLEYTILSATGRPRTVARIAHPGTHDTEAVELSVNPSGELIASWVHNDGASAPGTAPGSPGYVAAKLIVAVCKPALRCTAPQTVSLGGIKPACINPAVAISPDGTTTVIAAANDWGTGCNAALGIRASTTSGSGTRVGPMQVIQREGDWPVAAPDGNNGTVMAFNAGLSYSDSFAWSFIPATGTVSTSALLLDRGGYWNTGQQTLTPVNGGWYLITWTHSTSNNGAQLSLRAALGHDGQVQTSAVAVGASTRTAANVAATDGRGDAIILFSRSTDSGNGAPWPYSSGLYTTVLRP